MLNNIVKGVSAYGAAVRHISKYGLWGYVVLPGLLSLALGSIIFSAAWGWSDDLGGFISHFWIWEWGIETVTKVAQVFGGLLILALGAILYKQIVMVALAPFMSVLSEKVEGQLSGKKVGNGFSVGKAIKDIARGLRIAIRNLIRELLATVFLFVLGLIPVFTPFTTFLIFMVQSYYVGFGNMDFMLERHMNYKESVRFVKNNRGFTLGNGIIFMVLFLSIVGFLFALPLGTVAATIGAYEKLPKKDVKLESSDFV